MVIVKCSAENSLHRRAPMQLSEIKAPLHKASHLNLRPHVATRNSRLWSTSKYVAVCACNWVNMALSDLTSRVPLPAYTTLLSIYGKLSHISLSMAPSVPALTSTRHLPPPFTPLSAISKNNIPPTASVWFFNSFVSVFFALILFLLEGTL